jgi:probable O-glycosylation ligase (exosortase A-associated)
LRDLAFVAAWVVLLPLALQGAQFGVLLWTWTSLLAPNDVLYGMGTAVPFAKLAAVLTIGLLLIGRGGNIKFRATPTVLVMVGLAVSGGVSQATGLAADGAEGWDLYQKYVKILLLAVVVIWAMRDRIRLHALFVAICLGIGFTGLGEGAKFLLSGGGHLVLGTPSTGDNNQIGLDVLLIMPLLHYLHATAKGPALRFTAIVVALICAICVISTNSRAAFIGLGVLGVALVLSSKRKLVGLLVVGALAFGGSQLVSDQWVHRMDTIKTAEDDDSFLGRVSAWKVSTAVAQDRPLFGGGFHAIQHADVWASHLFEASKLDWFGTPPPAPNLRAAHSIYFEILGDLGYIGLALFLTLFAMALRNAAVVRGLVRRSDRADLRWAAAMAGALRVSVIVFLVGGASLSAAYYDIDYLLVAMLVALRELVERTLREPAAPPPAAALPIRARAAMPETVI